MRKQYSWRLIGFGKYERIETEIKEPRPAGFYWVKYSGCNGWTVAEWHGKDGYWSALHDSAFLRDHNFDMIHEQPIEKPMY